MVGATWPAPPGKDFSHLKLRRPGPKALRVPECMDGVPGLTQEEQRRENQSTEIHKRSRAFLRAAVQSTAQGGFEQPRSAMSWMQEDNIALLKEWAAHCSCVPACAFGLNFCKTWALCAMFASIASLAPTCNHPPGSHQVIAGLRQDGQYISSLTAEYLPPMAKKLVACLLPYVSKKRHGKVPSSDFADLLTKTYIHRRPAACDGAGMNSAADHTNPKSSTLKPLSTALRAYLLEKKLVEDIARSLAQGNSERPIAKHRRHELACIIHSHLHPKCNNPACIAVSDGQPFRLRLIQALAGACKDPDTALVPLLEKGVLTGTAPSNQWPRAIGRKPKIIQTPWTHC